MRNKLLLCLFVLTVCSLEAQAQNIHFGPELGYRNIPTLKTGETQYYQPGHRLGLRVDYGIIKHLSVSTGVYFTNNFKSSADQYQSDLATEAPILGILLGGFVEPGSELEFITNVGVTTSSSTSMNFMSFPILVKGDYKGFSATFGMHFDKLMSSSTNQLLERDIALSQFLDTGLIPDVGGFDIEALLPAASEEKIVDSKSSLLSLSTGITMGIGYKFNDFDLNLLYHKGLNDYRKPAVSPSDPYSSVSFSVGYLFSYKKLRGFQDRSTGEML